MGVVVEAGNKRTCCNFLIVFIAGIFSFVFFIFVSFVFHVIKIYLQFDLLDWKIVA